MKKIILVLGLMLGVCLSAYGISQSEVNDLYDFLDKQHEEHPGWVSIMLKGSDTYITDMGYYIGRWCGYYGYDVEEAEMTGPNKLEILLLNKEVLEENGLVYNKETKDFDEIPVKTYTDEYGAVYEVYKDGSVKVTSPNGMVLYGAPGGEDDSE